MIKSYNNEDDQKFKNVISSLRDLPRIAAPEDFEADLKRRINLLESSPDKVKKKVPERWSVLASLPLSKILYPAAIMITAVLLFFLLPLNTADYQQNQIARRAADTQQAKEDPGATAGKTGTLTEQTERHEITAAKPADTNSPVTGSGSQTPSGRTAALENDNDAKFASSEQLKKRIREFRFMGRENDVDKSLQAKPQSYGSGYQDGTQNVNFQGFDIIRDENPVLDEILRSRMDSMRRSQQRDK